MGVIIGRVKAVTCRYCAEEFVPLPGKPGYIDECSDCLHEKTAQQLPKPNLNLVAFDKQRNKLRRSLKRIGIADEKIDAIFLELEHMLTCSQTDETATE
jgi:hypothetical protein